MTPAEVDSLLQAGWLARGAGDQVGARWAARAVLDHWPGHGGASYLLGVLLDEAGLAQEADLALADASDAQGPLDDALLRRARLALVRGDGAAARGLLAQVLQRRPWEAAARRMLALVLLADGDTALARQVLLRHLREQRADTDALHLLARTQHLRGRRAAALRSAKLVLARDPGHLEASRSLALWASEAGNAPAAMDALQEVLRQDRLSPRTAVLAARVLGACGRLADAVQWANGAVAQRPGDPRAWRVLAELRLQQRHAADAAAAAARAVALAPDDARNLRLAARAALAADRPAEAIEPLQRAITALEDADTHLELGEALVRGGAEAAAIAQADAALAADPRSAAALGLRASALLSQGGPGVADACGAMLRADPRIPESVAVALRAAALGVADGAALVPLVPAGALRRGYLDAIAQAVQRHGYRELHGLVRHAMRDVSEDLWLEAAALYAAAFDEAGDRDALARKARDWVRALRLRSGASPLPAAWRAAPGTKPRIGYLASQPHAPLLRRVLAAHDPAAADVFLYVPGSPPGLPPHVRVRPLDARLTHACAADALDVVIDTGGLQPFLGQAEVLWQLSRRLAPVQVGWLGLLGPCGGLYDAVLTDEIAVPPAHEAAHDESVLRLAGGQWCWDPPPGTPGVAPPPALARGHATFGAVARGLRIGPGCAAGWARVLAAVPGSVLRLAGRIADDAPQRREFLQAFALAGIAADRVVFDGFQPPERWFGWFANVDVLLDSLPASCGFGLADALWMGVPVVTCAGRWAGERQGASLLHAAGRPEWVAQDADGFVRLAMQLAADVPALAHARQSQRERLERSPLLDGRRVAGQIEAIAAGLRAGLPTGPGSTRDFLRDHARWSMDRLLEGPRAMRMPAAGDAPDATVVVVLFNQAGLAWRTLQSLADQDGVAFEVVIVDNASSDRTGEMLARVHGARVLRMPRNEGFLAGAKAGAAQARGRHLAFLNSDAVLQPGALAAAVAALDADPTLGVVGGRVVLADGKLQEAGNRVFPDGRTLGIGRGEDPFGAAARAARTTDFVSGAFLATPAPVWQRLGGFDEAFAPAYYEDTDYCLRAWQAGLRVAVDPAIVLEHLEWGSASGASATELMDRNRALFARRHAAALADRPRAALPSLEADRWWSPEDLPVRRPRVLMLDNEVPHMARGGGLPRARLMLQALAGWPVTLLPLRTLDDDWRAVAATVPASVEVALGEGLAGLEAFLARRRGVYDVLLVSRPTNLAAIAPLRARRPELFEGLRLVYDAEALFALREILQAEVLGRPMSPAGQAAHLARELALAEGAADVLVVSDIDAGHFRAAGHRAHVLAHSAPPRRDAPGVAGRRGLLFVGALHPGTPNEDGLLWFVAEVLPRLRALGHAPELEIVGACHSPAVAALHGAQVRVLGGRDDLAPHYDAARVFVAPARFAGGVPAKVIEAAAAGIPCVASGLLVRQLGWQDGRDVLGAADAQAFAEGIARLLQDDALWSRVQAAAWAEGERRYGAGAFSRTLRDVLASREPAALPPAETPVRAAEVSGAAVSSFEDYYDRHWLPRGDYYAHHRRRFLQSWAAVEALQLPAAGRVLDVGAAGPLAAFLGKRGWASETTAVDLRGPLPLPGARFDLVLCTETLEHIKDRDSTDVRDLEAFNYSGVHSLLAEMRRVLAPDGRLLVTTPNASSWHMLAKWLQGEAALEDPRHVREFTPADLAAQAAACGLRVMEMRCMDSWSSGRTPELDAVAAVVRQLPLPAVPREDNILAVFARG